MPSCEACRLLHGGTEPCEQCMNIYKENIPVFKIYERVKNQHIMGFGGPVALNMIAVYPLIEKVVDEKEFFRCLELVEMLYYQVRIPQYIEEKRRAEFIRRAENG